MRDGYIILFLLNKYTNTYETIIFILAAILMTANICAEGHMKFKGVEITGNQRQFVALLEKHGCETGDNGFGKVVIYLYRLCRSKDVCSPAHHVSVENRICRRAHKENDRAVMAAYGFSTKMTESECVAELFKMYQELTK